MQHSPTLGTTVQLTSAHFTSATNKVAPEVVELLRRFIENGGYEDGARLPAERALAHELGVGRPALREAIKALSVMDVLESRRGDGTYVKCRAKLHGDWPAQLSSTATEASLFELLELRRLYEPWAAKLAAVRATEEQLVDMDQARAALQEKAGDWREVVVLDYEFHSSIVRASGNRILIEVNQLLKPLLIHSREVTARSQPGPSRMFSDHDAIFGAIVRGESEAAERAMLEHLHAVGLDLISERRR